MVTLGGTLSKVTVLSVLVEARLPVAEPSTAALALMLATTVPVPFMPVTDTVYNAPEPVMLAVRPVNELALRLTPAAVKPVTGSSNTTVNLIGDALVGSDWVVAWLIVTVGGW